MISTFHLQHCKLSRSFPLSRSFFYPFHQILRSKRTDPRAHVAPYQQSLYVAKGLVDFAKRALGIVPPDLVFRRKEGAPRPQKHIRVRDSCDLFDGQGVGGGSVLLVSGLVVDDGPCAEDLGVVCKLGYRRPKCGDPADERGAALIQRNALIAHRVVDLFRKRNSRRIMRRVYCIR